MEENLGHQGYQARVEYDPEARLFHGEVVGISDVITFQASTPGEVRKAFIESVDDYLMFCAERHEPPQRPYPTATLTPDMQTLVALANTYNPAMARTIEEMLLGFLMEAQSSQNFIAIASNLADDALIEADARMVLLRETANDARLLLHAGLTLDAAELLETITNGPAWPRVEALLKLHDATTRFVASEREVASIDWNTVNQDDPVQMKVVNDALGRQQSAMTELIVAETAYQKALRVVPPPPEQRKPSGVAGVARELLDAALEMGASFLDHDGLAPYPVYKHARDRLKTAVTAYRDVEQGKEPRNE